MLESKRLIITELSLEDVDLVYALRSNDDVIKYTCIEKYLAKDVAVSYVSNIIETAKRKAGYVWAIKRKEDELGIGSICLFNFEQKSGRAEIGYDLLPEYWGKGYIPEATKVIAEYALDVLGFFSLIAAVFPQNKRSVSVLLKLGFSLEGIRVDKESLPPMAIYELKK